MLAIVCLAPNRSKWANHELAFLSVNSAGFVRVFRRKILLRRNRAPDGWIAESRLNLIESVTESLTSLATALVEGELAGGVSIFQAVGSYTT